MPATPKDIPITLTAEWFDARWAGKCSVCGEWFNVGDSIRATGVTTEPGEPIRSGYECWTCGGGIDITESPDVSHPYDVMPPRRTKADTCGRCFLIHTIAQGDECQ